MSEVLMEKIAQLELRVTTNETDINEGKLVVMPMRAEVVGLKDSMADLKLDIRRVRELLEER